LPLITHVCGEIGFQAVAIVVLLYEGTSRTSAHFRIRRMVTCADSRRSHKFAAGASFEIELSRFDKSASFGGPLAVHQSFRELGTREEPYSLLG
jgi:hypothetical protein